MNLLSSWKVTGQYKMLSSYCRRVSGACLGTFTRYGLLNTLSSTPCHSTEETVTSKWTAANLQSPPAHSTVWPQVESPSGLGSLSSCPEAQFSLEHSTLCPEDAECRVAKYVSVADGTPSPGASFPSDWAVLCCVLASTSDWAVLCCVLVSTLRLPWAATAGHRRICKGQSEKKNTENQ